MSTSSCKISYTASSYHQNNGGHFTYLEILPFCSSKSSIYQSPLRRYKMPSLIFLLAATTSIIFFQNVLRANGLFNRYSKNVFSPTLDVGIGHVLGSYGFLLGRGGIYRMMMMIRRARRLRIWGGLERVVMIAIRGTLINGLRSDSLLCT